MKILVVLSVFGLFSIENASACAETVNSHPVKHIQTSTNSPRVIEEEVLPNYASLMLTSRFGVKVFNLIPDPRVLLDSRLFLEIEGRIFSWLAPRGEVRRSVSQYPNMSFVNSNGEYFFHQLAIETRDPSRPNVRIFYAMGASGNWVRNELHGRVHRKEDMPTSKSEFNPEAVDDGVSFSVGNAKRTPWQREGWLRTQGVDKGPNRNRGRSMGLRDLRDLF